MPINDDAHVNKRVEMGGMVARHDLRAVGGDQGRLGRARRQVDSYIQGLSERPTEDAGTQAISGDTPQLPAGTRLGPYEVLGPLGAGGWARSTARGIPG